MAVHRLWLALALGIALLVPATGARANDSTAVLESGDLQLTHNPHIRLVSEDLHLSAEEVRVRYLFRNTSDTDIVTIVAFPLPDITVGEDANYDVEATETGDFLGFEVTVDGRRIESRLQVRATRFGVDRTELLDRHDIPVLPFARDFHLRLERLSGEARAALERAGLVDWHSSFGANNVPLPSPHWTAHTAYYWEQRFPAGKTIEVRHRYRPVTGLGFFNAEIAEDRLLNEAYCMDAGFRRAAAARARKEDGGLLLSRELHYILTTANNWRGTIGDFRLTIDKGNPDHLVSLCIDNIRKTGPTTFEMRAKDFIPERDLKILLLQPMPTDLRP